MLNCQHAFELLEKFAGHDNAAGIDYPKAGDFLDCLLTTPVARGGKKLSEPSVEKYLSYIRYAYEVACMPRFRKLETNPFEKVHFTATEQQSRQDGFSRAETALMIAEARKSDKPHVRIPVLIAAYSGAVRGEIVDSSSRDFEETEHGLVFHIRETNRAVGLKTDYRPRRFPLHSAIVEDVRQYLSTIPKGPLFPQLTPDSEGSVSHRAGRDLIEFIKGCGIDRKGEKFHCHRHTFKTALRRVLPRDEETRNYITGHATKGVAADYGRVPLATLREVMDMVDSDAMKWELV